MELRREQRMIHYMDCDKKLYQYVEIEPNIENSRPMMAEGTSNIIVFHAEMYGHEGLYTPFILFHPIMGIYAPLWSSNRVCHPCIQSLHLGM